MEENTVAPKTNKKNQLFVVIIIVVLLAVAIMISQKVQNKEVEQIKMQEAVIQNDPITQQVQTQSSSDDTAAIEADLNSTNIDTLDQQ